MCTAFDTNSNSAARVWASNVVQAQDRVAVRNTDEDKGTKVASFLVVYREMRSGQGGVAQTTKHCCKEGRSDSGK